MGPELIGRLAAAHVSPVELPAPRGATHAAHATGGFPNPAGGQSEPIVNGGSETKIVLKQ
jgi:hypothetical protein